MARNGRRKNSHALGEITSAVARMHNRDTEIAELIGLSEATVRRRLASAHGNTLVRNVFEERWPSGDDDGDDALDIDVLGYLTAAAAWSGDREAAIAEATGLTVATVRRRLEDAHGNTLVRNVFEERWPSGDDDDDEVNVDVLGDMTAAAAWSEDREGAIAEVTGFTEATVRRRLEGVHGNTLVRNVFEEHWPSGDDDVDVDVLGEMTVAASSGHHEAAIAEATGLTEATVRRRLADASGNARVRNVFEEQWPSSDDGNNDDEVDVDVLGDMTAAAACSGGREAAIAEATGLTEATVRRRLGEAHGNTLVRNVFEERWPTDDDEVDVDVLGDMTAAAASSGNQEAVIAEATGLTEGTVRRRLAEASGNTRVRKVFEEQWPSSGDDDEIDLDVLGDMTAAAAWSGDREAAIAEVTGLTEATVRRRLEEAHGNTLVRNVFEERWPSNDDEVSVAVLGSMTVAAASSGNQEEAIAKATGLTEATVRRRLAEASGNTRVRNMFEEHWPSSSGDVEDDDLDIDVLGDLTAAAVRSGGREAAIAEATGLTEATVRRRLEEAHGNTLVRNVFEERWPSDDGDDVVDIDRLGDMTAAAASSGNHEAAIAEATGLTESTVRRRLAEASGNTRIRNAFEEYWPSGGDDNDGDDQDVNLLGDMTTAAAWSGDREAAIAEVTGLAEATVHRRLEEAHGNTLVRNVFEERWPSAAADDDAGVDMLRKITAKKTARTLGNMTALTARTGMHTSDIASLTGLREAVVHRRLAEADSRQLVRNLFGNRWPSKEAEPRGRPVAERSAPPKHDRSTEFPPSVPPAHPVRPPKSVHTAAVRQPVLPPEQSSRAMPKLPAALRAAYCSDNLAVFCGSGISLGADVQGHLPSWRNLPERLLDACERYEALDDETIDLKRRRFKRRMSLEQMLGELGSLRTDLGNDYQSALNDIFRPPNAAPGAAHRAVAELGVRAVLTTNYEQLLERVPEIPSRQSYTWKESSHALVDLKRKHKVLLKVHGTAERHDTVIMSQNDYSTARSDISYQAILRYLLQDHVFLFVGYGMNDPLDLDLALKYNAEAFKAATQRHYLLLRGPSDEDRDRYERDYSVRVIPYAEHAEVPAFLAQLAASKIRSL